MRLQFKFIALLMCIWFEATLLYAENHDVAINISDRDSSIYMQDSVDLKISIDELDGYLKYESRNSLDQEIKDLIEHRESHTQPFEDQNRHMILEKGVRFAGATFGFVSNDIDNTMYDPLAEIDVFYYRNLSVSTTFGYFVANNVALTGSFSYNFLDYRLSVSADILEIVIGASNYAQQHASSKYSGSFGVKNFIPLSRKQQMYIVTHTHLSYAYTSSITKSYYDGDTNVAKITKHNQKCGIGISPGFLYFVSRGLAFEFMFNPVEASWEHSKRINNDYNTITNNNYGLSFKFLPFNMSLGFSYYFGIDYNKHRDYLKRIKQY